MTREKALFTIRTVTENVLEHFIKEREKVGIGGVPMFVVPLIIARSALMTVADHEKERGEHATGMAQRMLKQINPLTDEALEIAITVLRMETPTEEELQAIAKQIQDMGWFKD